MSLADYVQDFRGRPACPCQVEWIPAFEHELQRRGIIQGLIPIAQLIGGFEASGGTHSLGGVSDFFLLGVQADVGVMVARQMGADPTWHRLRGWDNGGGVEHVHSVLRGCPHLSQSARDQIIAVDAGGDGLIGPTPDPGPRPLSFRDWREGIAWQQQQEDDMPSPKDWTSEDWAAVKKNLPSAAQIAAAVWTWDKFNNAKDKAKALLLLASGKGS